MKQIIRFMLIALLSSPLAALAKIGEHPIILIQGFQANHLRHPPPAHQVNDDGEKYWEDFWLLHADERIDWPSNERISGKISTDYLWPKLKTLSRTGLCDSGCIFVTHSTGDLVARYIIENQENWLKSANLEPLLILATIDIAGAGGGAELADAAINIANGGGIVNDSLRALVSLWLGAIPTASNLGVINDLRVATARQLAIAPSDPVPRLRFVGGKSDLPILDWFIPGADDGVVSSHSSCGATKNGAFGSCSSSIAFNGLLRYQKNAVPSFLPWHFPVLMGEKYSHNSLITDTVNGPLTAANQTLKLKNNKQIRINTTDEKVWWFLTYRRVDGSDSQSLSTLLLRLLQE
ncbi:hypothetical protein [Veronia pacifica]|uniref:DUF676 domain-containing protein n=1 Tax=Veronia pacifica TaxID=1080227 RepID=A0A1C3E9J1_9GAMM|nr:hypothetical protein [Veronia pacifica]ODA29915.1 hypothetical protein A8L45_21155 [Veronia pacifica]